MYSAPVVAAASTARGVAFRVRVRVRGGQAPAIALSATPAHAHKEALPTPWKTSAFWTLDPPCWSRCECFLPPDRCALAASVGAAVFLSGATARSSSPCLIGRTLIRRPDQARMGDDAPLRRPYSIRRGADYARLGRRGMIPWILQMPVREGVEEAFPASGAEEAVVGTTALSQVIPVARTEVKIRDGAVGHGTRRQEKAEVFR